MAKSTIAPDCHAGIWDGMISPNRMEESNHDARYRNEMPVFFVTQKNMYVIQQTAMGEYRAKELTP